MVYITYTYICVCVHFLIECAFKVSVRLDSEVFLTEGDPVYLTSSKIVLILRPDMNE